MTRVMMVDDEVNLVWALARTIGQTRPDLVFEGFTDAEEAMRSLRQAPPDLLVTDIRMPVVSGVDLILQALALKSSLPVVVVSAYEVTSVQAQIPASARIRFLTKPFTVDILLLHIDELLAQEDGFSGSVSLPMLPDLVQLLVLSRRSGCLRVEHGAEIGEIWLADGEMVHAQCGGLESEEAVYHLLTWRGGRFTFAEGAAEPKRTISHSWQQVLLEGCRRLDESRAAEPPVAQDPVVPTKDKPEKGEMMANLKETLAKLTEIDGFIGSCIVDSNSGMMLGSEGGNSSLNLEVAAAGNTEVVRAKRKTMKGLALKDAIEDILITLGKQYHLIRPLASNEAIFVYLVLDRGRSNLALARHALSECEKGLVVA